MKRHELNAVIDIRQVSPAAMAQLRSCVIDSELFETPTPPLRVADGFVSHLIWIEHNNPYESSVESTLSDSALYTIHRQILAQAYLLSTVAK